MSVGLFAAACSKKNDNSSATTTPVTTAPATTPVTGGTTPTTGGTTPVTEAPTTTAPAEKPTPGGSIIVSGEAEVGNPWTPAKINCDSYCQQRARTFFEPLGAYGTDDKVHPYLAESITPNADSTQWTIKLRSGIKFTDGTPLNADAAIRNLQDTGTGLLIAPLLLDVAKNPDKSLKITKVDDLTFTIFTGKAGDPNTPLSWPGFDFALATQWGFMASPTWLDAAKADPLKEAQPVGTGPFILQSFAPHDSLVVVKNPNYWQKDADGVQLPYLDKITFKVIEDSQTAQQALENGEIDITSTSSSQVIAALRKESDKFPMTELNKFTETNYLLIDLAKKAPTQDARVRCALSMAIDRQELINLTEGGILQPANGLFSPGQQGYLEDNGFNPAQQIDAAKALIDDYKKSTGATDVTVTFGHTADRILDQTADLLKGYWAKIGVTTNVETIPQDQFIVNALLGADNFFIYGWRLHSGHTIDEQNFWWNSASGTKDGALSLNFSRMNDPDVDKQLAIARSDPDPAKRDAAAQEVNRIMAKQCYAIPISYTLWGTAHATKVMGLGQTVMPDGAIARDGAGFPGQFWMNYMWVKQG